MKVGFDDIVIAAPTSVAYRRFSNESAHWWLLSALRDMLNGAGLRPGDIDGLTVSSFTLHPDSAVGFVQHSGLAVGWLEHLPMGGASGIIALRRAARAVQAGDAEIVACLSGDTNQLDSFRQTLSRFSNFSNDAAWPYGSGGANGYFALLADYYMRKFDVGRETFARIAASQRANAQGYPHALLNTPLSVDDYLRARMIAAPLGLFDCVMPCAGAESFLVMRADRAAQLGLAAVRPLAIIERHNGYAEDPVQFRGGWAYERDQLWQNAGCGPDDIDLVQTYDDYPVISLMQLEDLGFFEKGDGAAFIANHDLTCGGDFPHNSSGGQLSVGQAGAAGGFLGIVEAVRQLTGAPIGTPVSNAEKALISGFGMVNYDRGVCSAAAVLEAAG
jgi:acetyl-CoA acetyltransferase